MEENKVYEICDLSGNPQLSASSQDELWEMLYKKGMKEKKLKDLAIDTEILPYLNLKDCLVENCYITGKRDHGRIFTSVVTFKNCTFENLFSSDGNYSWTDFFNCKFKNATLTYSKFSDCFFGHSNFNNTALRYDTFIDSTLSHSCLLESDFTYSFIETLKITKTEIDELTKIPAIYETNFNEDIIGWKAVYTKEGQLAICKMKIPSDAIKSIQYRHEYRCSYAIPIEFQTLDGERKEDMECTELCLCDSSMKYRIGEPLRSETWEPNIYEENAVGVHFYVLRDYAVFYGVRN